MDGISELAKLFKERENKSYLGPQIGRVISGFPNIRVALGNRIILNKRHLIFASHILEGYEREFSIEGEQIKFSQEENSGETGLIPIGETDLISISEHEPHQHMVPGDMETDLVAVAKHDDHQHIITKINIDTEYESKGIIKWTNSLEVGDELILIPSSDEQKYYVIDKMGSV